MKATWFFLPLLALYCNALNAQSESRFTHWYEALATGRADSILSWAQSLDSAGLQDPRSLILLSRAHMQMGQPEKAIACIEPLLHPDSMQADLRVYMAELYESQQYIESAFIQYSWLVSRLPERAEYWYGLGRVSEQMEELESAAFYFHKARQLDSSKAEYSIRLAKALVKINQQDSALHAMELVAPAFADHRGFQLTYSEMLYRNSAFVPALKVLGAIHHRPAYHQMLQGLSYMQTDSFAAAKRVLEGLPDKLLKYETVQASLGRACLQLGDTTAAMDHLDAALGEAISPNTHLYYLDKARVYLQLQLLDQARSAVYKGLAIKRTPELTWLNAHIAEIQGRNSQAKSAYREFVQLADSTLLEQVLDARLRIDSLERLE